LSVADSTAAPESQPPSPSPARRPKRQRTPTTTGAAAGAAAAAAAAGGAAAEPMDESTTTNTSTSGSRFLFLVGTCSSEEGGEIRRARVLSLIDSLGGSVLVPPGGMQEDGRDGFDLACTHVVAFRPKRTLKLLAGVLSGKVGIGVVCGLVCLVGGGVCVRPYLPLPVPHISFGCTHKWVLRPEYLEASHAAGRFLDEAAFEWGGTSSSKDDDGKVCIYCERNESLPPSAQALFHPNAHIHRCGPAPTPAGAPLRPRGGGPLQGSASFCTAARSSAPRSPS
jgi:hypothetical protein